MILSQKKGELETSFPLWGPTACQSCVSTFHFCGHDERLANSN